jgi:hypothetical protein
MPETVPDNGVLADVVSGLAAFGRRWRESAGDWSVERSPRGGSGWGRHGGCRRLRRLPVCLGLGLGLGRDEVAFLDERIHFAVAADDEAELLGSQATGGDGFLVALELPAQSSPYGKRELRGAGLAARVTVPPM